MHFPFRLPSVPVNSLFSILPVNMYTIRNSGTPARVVLSTIVAVSAAYVFSFERKLVIQGVLPQLGVPHRLYLGPPTGLNHRRPLSATSDFFNIG